VVVILMMAPVALPLARALKLPVTPLVLMIGFAANFMGSAMLLGDLPPQMLHSVAGAEFIDFFRQHGRPPRTGRRALGSETQKVLTHAKVPVLVCR